MRGDTDTSAIPVPDPLTVNGVSAWRAKVAQIPTGVAAACSSDMFKSPVGYFNKERGRLLGG